MAVTNIKSYTPVVKNEPPKDNSASKAASEILNGLGVNPKAPKALGNMDSGTRENSVGFTTSVKNNGSQSSGINAGNGPVNNQNSGNGIIKRNTIGSPRLQSAVSNVLDSGVNTPKQKPLNGDAISNIVNSNKERIGEAFPDVGEKYPSMHQSMLNPNRPQRSEPAFKLFSERRNEFKPRVQVGQYLNSKGINAVYDEESGGLFAGGYRIPVLSVENDIPYAYTSDADDIYNKIMYGGNDNDLLSVKHYVGDKGFIDFNPETGKYYLNGQPIPGTKVENGVFYAPKGEIDRIINGPQVDTIKYLNTKGISPEYDSASGNYFYNGYKLSSSVNDNVHYSNQSELDKIVSNITAGGSADDIIGVRAYVGDKGELEYDENTGKVSLNGFEVPVTTNENGRVYAKRGDIDTILSRHDYKNGNIVRVADYVKQFGPDAVVSWDDEGQNVFINGVKLDYDHLSDGRAYADKKLIDKIINQTVINNPNSQHNMLQRIYDSFDDAKAYRKKLEKNSRFEYDYKDDPQYQAYLADIDRRYQVAIDNAIGNAISRTGGVMNSYAAALAGSLAMQGAREKSAIIPQLYQMAFDRWNAGRTNDIELYNSDISAASNIVNALSDLYGVNTNANVSQSNNIRDNATKQTISDNEIAYSEKRDNKQLDLDWAVETNKTEVDKKLAELEELKVKHSIDSETQSTIDSILSSLEGYNGVVQPSVLISVYDRLSALNIPDEVKQKYFDIINSAHGTNFRLIDDILAEQEAGATTDAVTNPAVANIMNSNLNSYYGSMGGVGVNDPYGLLGGAGGNSLYGGQSSTGASAAEVYGFPELAKPKKEIEAPPTSPYYYESKNYNKSGNTSSSNKGGSSGGNKSNGSGGGTKTKTTTKSGGGNKESNTTSSVAPGFKFIV